MKTKNETNFTNEFRGEIWWCMNSKYENKQLIVVYEMQIAVEQIPVEPPLARPRPVSALMGATRTIERKHRGCGRDRSSDLSR